MEETYQNNGRSTNGKFAEGNTYGKGRPKLETERLYLHAVREACDFETWKSIVKKSVEQANEGDPKARNFLANYLIGKPEQKNFLLIDTNENGNSIKEEEAKRDARFDGMSLEEINELMDNEFAEMIGDGKRIGDKIIFVRFNKREDGTYASSIGEMEFKFEDEKTPEHTNDIQSEAVTIA